MRLQVGLSARRPDARRTHASRSTVKGRASCHYLWDRRLRFSTIAIIRECLEHSVLCLALLTGYASYLGGGTPATFALVTRESSLQPMYIEQLPRLG